MHDACKLCALCANKIVALFFNCDGSLMVRTLPCHGGNPGSNFAKLKLFAAKVPAVAYYTYDTYYDTCINTYINMRINTSIRPFAVFQSENFK